MYWLGIVGSALTHEQRILAQRSSLSQPHPPQKFRAIGRAKRPIFCRCTCTGRFVPRLSGRSGHVSTEAPDPSVTFLGLYYSMTCAVQHIYGMRQQSGNSIQRIHRTARTPRQIQNYRGPANSRGSTRQNCPRRFLQTLRAHLLRKPRNQSFCYGQHSFRRHVTRPHASPASREDQIHHVRIRCLPQKLGDALPLVRQNLRRHNFPTQIPAAPRHSRTGTVRMLPAGYRIAHCKYGNPHEVAPRFSRDYPSVTGASSLSPSRCPSSTNRSASISSPVVVREMMSRVGARLKSISNSPSGQRTASNTAASPSSAPSRASLHCPAAKNKSPLSSPRRIVNWHDFCPISSDCIKSIIDISSSRPCTTPGRTCRFCNFSSCSRSTTFFARRTKSFRKNGLGINSSTPSTIGRNFSSMSLRLARKKNGIAFVCCRPRNFSYSWRPSSPGMRESHTTRSGGSSPIFRRASAPS